MSEEVKVPGKRGRPKGSKNKPRDPNETNEDKAMSLEQKRADRAEKNAARYAQQSFSYTSLAETALGNIGLYYLAGVVIDSTMPHQNPKTGKYACYVKIIDASMCYREANDPGVQMGSYAAAKAFSRN